MLLRIYFSLCLINFINFNEAVNLRCPNSTCFCDENSVLQVVDEWDSSEVSDLPKLIVKCPHENRAEIEVQIVKS